MQAGKFVVLSLGSCTAFLVLHQSRKEPGMKCIKAAFFWEGGVRQKKKRGRIKAGLESGEWAARGLK